jgi:hypothetical protein
MCKPLLIRQNVIRQLYINYDPFIDIILHECELLARYSITMPDLGYKLLLDKNRIQLYYERLKVYKLKFRMIDIELIDILDINQRSFSIIS